MRSRVRDAIIERRARKIARSRYLVLSISATLVVIALVCAAVIRIFDHHDYPTFGGAAWWAIQTFTTVGYGDNPPTTSLGRFVASIEMVAGIMFLSFLTAAVTTELIQKDDSGDAPPATEADAREIKDAIAELERRLEELAANRPPPSPG